MGEHGTMRALVVDKSARHGRRGCVLARRNRLAAAGEGTQMSGGAGYGESCRTHGTSASDSASCAPAYACAFLILARVSFWRISGWSGSDGGDAGGETVSARQTRRPSLMVGDAVTVCGGKSGAKQRISLDTALPEIASSSSVLGSMADSLSESRRLDSRLTVVSSGEKVEPLVKETVETLGDAGEFCVGERAGVAGPSSLRQQRLHARTRSLPVVVWQRRHSSVVASVETGGEAGGDGAL